MTALMEADRSLLAGERRQGLARARRPRPASLVLLATWSIRGMRKAEAAG